MYVTSVGPSPTTIGVPLSFKLACLIIGSFLLLLKLSVYFSLLSFAPLIFPEASEVLLYLTVRFSSFFWSRIGLLNFFKITSRVCIDYPDSPIVLQNYEG